MFQVGVRSSLAFFSCPLHSSAKEVPVFPDEETATQRGELTHPRPHSSGHGWARWPQLSLELVVLPSLGLWVDPGWQHQHHLGSLFKTDSQPPTAGPLPRF